MKLLLTLFSPIILFACSTISDQYPERKPPDLTTFYKQAGYPLEASPPQYPRKAAIRNIEGWVLFEFNLSQAGKPTNLKVIDSYPQGIFEEEASKAFKEWTFQHINDVDSYKYILEFKLR
ncbi:energy transducer TonB [Kangiella sp. TOML190]|uniref:energy transducer TonB n=1 Tax=Kangiella sp. TOML190 TaxID=2931351 RepID=UPI00204087CF|nr:energy transducer TonB [Kangiella sp. TOML190]